ncbi:molybdopterin dinucleotide binding domain-containing protein [Natranaerobius trueperi]|uniref:Molybdopterin dinucleotide-binding domain-containing protein n=1 Tax=Natranaerobius trueperi TaxID=759412 RepID=A0A226BY21_9FIRM|nr:molybdopterin dinucleotide binding domain-containing protein [Natranaerobius trueperi]OWZ83040.1 hypothetical protein CDO51_10785 [Natranaerobius trueperi]
MFVTRGNPFLQAPDTNKVYQAFKRVNFKIVVDMFMTDTAKNADLILPCTSFLEEEDIYITSMGHNYVSYGSKVINNLNNTKSDREIFNLLANEMNLKEFPIKDSNEWLKDAIKPLEHQKGLTFSMIKEEPYPLPEAPLQSWKDKKFLTPSGKFELYSEKAKEEGISPLAEYLTPFKDFQTEYDLHFLTPHYKGSLHSQHFKDKEQNSLGIAYINPKTANDKQISENDIVTLISPAGSLSVQIKFEETLREDSVYMYEGQWINKGGSVNTLVVDNISDAGDQAALYETKIKIEKV